MQLTSYKPADMPPAADSQTTAGGPFEFTLPPAPPADLAIAETDRTVRVASRSAVAGHKVIVPVEMKALGNELAIRFTLQYDAMKLSNPVVSITGVAPADAVLTVNDKENGRLTVLVDAGSAFLSIDGSLVNVTFDVSPTAATGESVSHLPTTEAFLTPWQILCLPLTLRHL